ncbi:MAG: hypothetical protein ACREX5_10975 [Achromobacter pestifer]
MGTFRKRGDTWRAEVSKGGARESKTFVTKREVQEWAASRETELATTAVGGIVVKTLVQVLERFRDEVSPRNKGHRWERVRIDRFLKEEPALCTRPMHTVTTVDLAAWRDRRLTEVQPTSCRRAVPLSKRAVSLFKALMPVDKEHMFTLTGALRGMYFRYAKTLAQVEGASFHDARATALTRLAKKLSILELARMVGHRDPRSLMVYYRESGSGIAKKLN